LEPWRHSLATLPVSTDEPELTEEEHPEAIADPSEPPAYGQNNRDLPRQLKEAIDGLVKTFSLRDMYDRRIEVLMDRILRFYDDGVQHVYPNFGTGVYQVGVSGGYVDIGNGRQLECPEYMGAYNIFRRDRRTLHSVLTQNPPGIDFIPNKIGQPECEESAEIAEGYRHFFDTHNDVKGIQEQLSRFMCLSGRVVSRVYSAKNAQRWGYNEQGQPAQMETVWVGGTLETRVPITTRDFDKCIFVFLYADLDILQAKAQNQWIRSKIAAGEAALGESDWERFARLGVKQARKGYYLTGQALAHLVTEMHCYLRPDAFEDSSCDMVFTDELPEDAPEGFEFPAEQLPDDKGEAVTIRSVLNALFPEGLHCKYIGKNYSEAWNEAMDDAIDIGFPDTRDGMTGGALMEPAKVTQDEFNDFNNAQRENYEKGWPATYFKGGQTDYNSIADTRSAPGRFHLLRESAPDIQIEGQLVYREPGFDVPQSFVDAMANIRQTLQPDLVGALPALTGNTPTSKTASGQAMDRSQAMGIIGPAWANIQRMWAGIYTKAVLLASKNPDHGEEIATLKSDGTKATLQLSKIRKGTFKAKPDVDSSFPDSTAAKRQMLQQLLPLIAPTPLGAALFQSPDNWEEIVEIMGNQDLVLIPAVAYKKQMRETEILLSAPPVPNDAAVAAYNQQHAAMALQAIAQGMPEPPYQPPPPLAPSIMPEEADYHLWESANCQETLSGEDVWLRLKTGDPEQIAKNLAGIQNLRLHYQVHMQMLAAQQPPPMPAPGPQIPVKPKSGPPGAPEAAPQTAGPAAPPGAGAPSL
jgi:hypothetical protein